MSEAAVFILIIPLVLIDLYYTRERYKANLIFLKLEVENHKARMKLEDKKFKLIMSRLDDLCEKAEAKPRGLE